MILFEYLFDCWLKRRRNFFQPNCHGHVARAWTWRDSNLYEHWPPNDCHGNKLWPYDTFSITVRFSILVRAKMQGSRIGLSIETLKLVTLILDAWHTPCPSIGLWYLSVCLRRYFYYSKYHLKYHLRFVYNV